MSARHRRRTGKLTTAAMGCRTPGKRGWQSEDDLRRNLSRDLAASGITAYKCSCGYWHASTAAGRRRNQREENQ